MHLILGILSCISFFVFTPGYIYCQSCSTLPVENICYNILPTQGSHVGCSSTSINNNLLTRNGILATHLWSSVPPLCAQALAAFQCASAFPFTCQTNNNLNQTNIINTIYYPPCQSMCNNIINNCGSYSSAILNLLNLNNCSSLGSSNCSNFNVESNVISSKTSSCAVYSPANGGKYCDGVFPQGYSVYLEPGATIASVEANFLFASTSFLLAAAPHTCAIRMASYLCQKLFPRCDSNSTIIQPLTNPSALFPITQTPLSITLPAYQSYQDCNQMIYDCLDTFNVVAKTGGSAGILLKSLIFPSNCSSIGTNPWSGSSSECNGSISPALSDFPSVSTTFATIQTTQGQIAISSIASSITASGVVLNAAFCPSPLIATNQYDTNLNKGLCQLPCRSILWTDSEWKINNILLFVFSLIAFLLVSFNALTWIIFHEKREQTLVVLFNICFLFVIIQFIFQMFIAGINMSDLTCKDSTTKSRQGDNSFCPVQGFFFHFGVMAGVGLWSSIAVELFVKVFWGAKLSLTQQKIQRNCLYVWSIAYPSIVSIPLLITQGYGTQDGINWCFIYNHDDQWPYFFYPASVVGVLVTIMISLVLISLYRSSKAVFRSIGSKKNYQQYIRSLLFVFIFYLLFAYLIGFNADIKVNFDTYQAAGEAFVACLLTNPTNTESACGKAPNPRPNVFANYFNTIIAGGGGGVSVFLIYGFSNDNLKLWHRLLKNCSRAHVYSEGSSGQQNSRLSATNKDNASNGASRTPKGGGGGGKDRRKDSTFKSNSAHSGGKINMITSPSSQVKSISPGLPEILLSNVSSTENNHSSTHRSVNEDNHNVSSNVHANVNNDNPHTRPLPMEVVTESQENNNERKYTIKVHI